MNVKPLHDNKSFIEDCAKVLNEEWKRSLAARLHSLEKSNDNFPINLVMTILDNGKEEVIGHSRLSRVQGKDNSCLIESVVVKKGLRGKGYGREIMQASEKFAAERGFSTMYLSTHDKQDFYQHIGYTFCKPVVSFGINTDNLPLDFMQKLSMTDDCEDYKVQQKQSKTACDSCTIQSENKNANNSNSSNNIVVPPPPVAPPPPPVAPSGSNSQITRWDPSAISWMKKDL